MLTGKQLWITIIIYLSVLLVVSSLVNYHNSKKKDSNIFKSQLSWPMAIMTYIASLMSTWLFFAGPGGYYRGGMVYWAAEMTWMPMFMILAHFVTNKVWAISRSRNYVTPSDFFCDRFKSPTLRIITALIFLISSLPYVTSVMASIAQGAVVASDGAISYNVVVLFIGMAMVIFTSVGGFSSVALTDTIQGLAFMFCIWFISLVCLKIGFNGSLTSAISAIIADSGTAFFSYPGPYNWVPYGYRFGYPFACMIGYSVMLPHVFVRANYASKDLKTQRRLATWTPCIRLFVWTGCFVIGIVGMALMPGLEKSATEYLIPYLIKEIVAESYPALPAVLMICFFVGATGVGISTADSYLLVAGSIIADDFLGNILKIKLEKRQKENVGRLVILAIGALGVIMALNPPGLIMDMIMFSIALVMPLFPIMVFALYWKRSTTAGAIAATVVGCILIFLTYKVWNIGGTYYGAIGALGSTLTMIIVSLFTKDDEKTSEPFYEALEQGLLDIYEVDPSAK